VQIAALVLAVAGGPDAVLYDFQASWCAPCRSMEPMVAELQRAGYPVRKVDVDRQRALADRHRVTSIPCFVLRVGGQEVGRVTGASRRSELLDLFAKGGVQPAGSGGIARAQSPDNHAQASDQRPVPTSVREPAPLASSAAPMASAAPINPQDL